MSSYKNFWEAIQKDLVKKLQYETLLKKKGPIKDSETAKLLIGRLFLGYVQIINKLDECYGQMIHPQKRELMKRLMDISIGRLLEIKTEIVAIELDDYIYFDNILMEMKIIPDDLLIRIPQHYWQDREKSKAHQRELINELYNEMKEEKSREEYLSNYPEDEREVALEEYLQKKNAEILAKQKQEEEERRKRILANPEDTKSLQENVDEGANEITKAIILVQKHERARQARRKLPIFKSRYKIRRTGKKILDVPEEISNKAAIIIQQHWRRRWKIILQKRKFQRELTFLGMVQPSWRDMSCYRKLEEMQIKKRILQEKNQEEYEKAINTIKEKLSASYSITMNEDITDEIRAWFEWFYLNAGNFPDYPDEKLIIPNGETLGIPKKISKEFIEKTFPQKKKFDLVVPKTKLGVALSGIQPIGGSALVVANHWIEPKDFLIIQKELERLKKSGGKDKTEKKKLSKEEKAALKKKEKLAEQRRLEAEAAEGFRLHESNFLLPLNKAEKEYRDYWSTLDESKNYEQRYDYDLIKSEKCYELSMEVRQIVDEAMRLELDLLKDALEKDRNPKKRKKKKKKKKSKKKKGSKGKKDPTGDRTNDELFKELFKNGIIKEYEETHIKDFLGERSYSAYDLRKKLEDGRPSPGDVVDLILQMCILPLGSHIIHQLSPIIRSVCLIGPEQSGKEFLTRIVCTETASVLFDLTPENTAGKYTTKAELKMLIHLIEKMSRILQPSVILVDGTEKLFYKKVPKAEKQLNPKRFGGTLKKIIKTIKPEDQVLVLGISSYPWLCRKQKLLKTYERFIYVPRPDYGTYFMLWQKLLTPYHSLARDFDFSCLATVSQGYSISTIINVVKNVMTPDRIIRSRIDPYKPSDFMEELCKMEPINEKILGKSNGFYDKTDQRKRRLLALKQAKEAQSKIKK